MIRRAQGPSRSRPEGKRASGEGARGSLHFVEAPGLWLSVRAGELALRQRDGRYVDLDRRIKTIVATARGFCVTTPAIRYCGAKHIELLISDDAAAFVSLFAPTAIGDARRTALKVRERQFKAVFDRKKSLEIAKAIVARKVKAEGHRRETRIALEAELQRAKSADDVRHAEAKAAQVRWSQWAGTEMRFADPAVPADWRSWSGRRWRVGGSIHGAGCGASDAGHAKLCDGDRDGAVDKGDRRNGIRPVLWVST